MQPFVPYHGLLRTHDSATQIYGRTTYLANDDNHAFILS